MNVILVPGFWLGASSWDAVTPALVAAGHAVHPITPPGLESADTDRSGITVEDHLSAVVDAIDAVGAPVVLVGHSGGGPTVYAAAGRRPDAVRRTVLVDAGPLVEGHCINDELPVVDDEVPLPDWSFFDDGSLVGLDDALRAAFRAQSVPEPLEVARGPFPDAGDAARGIPLTVVCCEMTGDDLRGAVAGGVPWAGELARARDVTYVDLPTGHWPQFSRPDDLGRIVVDAVAASEGAGSAR